MNTVRGPVGDSGNERNTDMYGSTLLPGQPDGAVQAMIDRVRRTALMELDGATFPDLDDCVIGAVTTLSQGNVAGFVPLLAIRHVRCCIRAGSCDCGVS